MGNSGFPYQANNGETCEIVDTYAEMFPMWAGRILITADSEKWATTGAEVATGFATSVIMSPAEAGVESILASSESTPDKRVGRFIQIYHRSRFDLKSQMILRIGQCVMTCPTTAAFDGLSTAKRKVKVGRSVRLFGDGFQRKSLISGRRVWRIPVMEGNFVVEDAFGIMEAVAGGNFIIMARDRASGLAASEKAVKAIVSGKSEVILPFPGGVCRSGSKAGSLKYKLKASTNHPFCPGLRTIIEDSQVPEGVECVYEIVIDGLTLNAVRRAIGDGLKAAAGVPGIVRLTAGNYGGKLGPYKVSLKEALEEH